MFSDWLQLFDAYIGRTFRRHALLLMENCSAHGTIESQHHLQSAIVRAFSPNKTSRLQPLDAGVIKAMGVRYTNRQMKHAIDLMDIGSNDIYKVGILPGIKRLISVWDDVSSETITNCSKTSGPLNTAVIMDKVTLSKTCERDKVLQDISGCLTSQIAPELKRLSISELLNCEVSKEVTETVTEKRIGDGSYRLLGRMGQYCEVSFCKGTAARVLLALRFALAAAKRQWLVWSVCSACSEKK